jgi:hypothetical protein
MIGPEQKKNKKRVSNGVGAAFEPTIFCFHPVHLRRDGARPAPPLGTITWRGSTGCQNLRMYFPETAPGPVGKQSM